MKIKQLRRRESKAFVIVYDLTDALRKLVPREPPYPPAAVAVMHILSKFERIVQINLPIRDRYLRFVVRGDGPLGPVKRKGFEHHAGIEWMVEVALGEDARAEAVIAALDQLGETLIASQAPQA